MSQGSSIWNFLLGDHSEELPTFFVSTSLVVDLRELANSNKLRVTCKDSIPKSSAKREPQINNRFLPPPCSKCIFWAICKHTNSLSLLPRKGMCLTECFRLFAQLDQWNMELGSRQKEHLLISFLLLIPSLFCALTGRISPYRGHLKIWIF